MNKNSLQQYQHNFREVLTNIQNARRKVYQQANATLIELYWSVGRYISHKVETSEWGKSVVNELALFITEKEPDIQGFSASNLWRMKQFYETYQNLPHCGEFLPKDWLSLSWSHHRRIMTLKSYEERIYYLTLCVKNKYSVRELEKLIKSGYFERTMLANENLSEQVKKLPQATENIFKDSYVFDFLNLPKVHREKDLQQALVSSLKEFILELGGHFSFIGQEYRLQVGNDDFYVDLLFFHREMQCLVAFELKTEKFKPQFMGQLEFYLEALDRNVKLPQENPSIGVCYVEKKIMKSSNMC